MKKSSIMLFVALLAALSVGEALAEMVAVRNDNVNMRSGPSLKDSVLWKLGQGFPLEVLERAGSWLKVRDFEGDSDWIHQSVVNRSGHMIAKRRKVNIRSGPKLNSRIVAKADYGVVFKTLDRQNGWIKIRQGGGVTGWVREDLLWGF